MPPAAGEIGRSKLGGQVFNDGTMSGPFNGWRVWHRDTSSGALSTSTGIVRVNATRGSALGTVNITFTDDGLSPSATFDLDDKWTFATSNRYLSTTGTPLTMLRYRTFLPSPNSAVLSGSEILYSFWMTARYGRLYSTTLSTSNGDHYFMYDTVGADQVSVPATGTATFNSAVVGDYYDRDRGFLGEFVGDGTIVANFGARTASGTFVDVDWFTGIDTQGASADEFGPGGVDFGLDFSAAFISNDDYRGTITTRDSGGVLPSLSGTVTGDFYGPTNAAPVETAGVFSLGASHEIIGGFYGVKR